MAQGDRDLQKTWLPSDTEDTTNPSYYKSLPKNVEVYEILEEIINRDLGFSSHMSYVDLGHVLRYTLRLGEKNGSLQELKKVKWYLDKLLERESGTKQKEYVKVPTPTPGAIRASWVPETDYPDEGD